MDKNVLKKFAIESRQELMEKVTNKISRYYVDEEFDVNQNGEVYVLVNDKHTLRLTKGEYENRQLLIKRIKEITLEQVIEEAAYTWFNRIIAIRYMEIHDYLPLTKDNQSLGVRVLSSKDNTPDPEIMKISNLINPDLDIEFNKEYYGSIQDNNKRFEYILLLTCKKLGKVIPQVFDGITDYIDILIPDNLLNESGYVTKLLKDVSEDNFKEVEIIGWLYQYYNQTEKDRVISTKKAYKKNEIPYATQLFTPDWIVKYMVENSLGKYWIEHGGNIDLIKNWKYFIKENINLEKKSVNDSELNNMSVNEINDTIVKLDPKNIKCIDPCCGSGHILVYMFEVLVQIYESYGYSKKDIAELILKNNLYGLDIDDRAGQLSILSVLLKAREYDKEIFNNSIIRKLNIMSIQETNTIKNAIFNNINIDSNNEYVEYLMENFENAKEIGSLLLLQNNDYSELEKNILEEETIFGIELRNKLIPIIKIANILSNKYEIVVTNPPYMSNSSMTKKLSEYVKKYYSDSKMDLYSAFIEACMNMTKKDGIQAMVTIQGWMFLSSFKKLRYKILQKRISSLIRIGYNSFPELNSQVVHACAFVVINSTNNNLKGKFFELNTGKVTDDKEKIFLKQNESNSYYLKSSSDFEVIPGFPLAFTLSDRITKIFKNKKLSDLANPKQGLATGENSRFLRMWYEVKYNKIKFDCKSIEEAAESDSKWFPYNKGGDYRKWYGNNDYVVNWENNGYEIRNFYDANGKLKSRPQNTNYYFKESITWSKISTDTLAFRYKPYGHIFDVAGTSFFARDNLKYYLHGLCNSSVAMKILKSIAPTLNFEVGHIASLPVIYEVSKEKDISILVNRNIKLSQEDWDSFETSWDFKKHPLLEFRDSMPGLHDSNIKVTPTHLKIIKNSYGEECYIADELPMNAKISDSFRKWEEYTQKQFNTLKQNEEKLNEIFIDIYDLKDELTPEVADKDITIRKADKEREIKSLISYAVGCMFGRYSLDKEGLIYAGGDFDEIYKKYKEPNGGWAGVSLSNYKVLNDNGNEIDLSFEVDKDNIIPITDEAYLGDDIVERFKKFISVAYGEKNLYENLEFIGETLGKRNSETSEDCIRRYFINDFYNDHLKIYQKRPIYWLFDSGKKNGFKCLIYMHRYNEGLVSKIRLDYLHKAQNLYEKELKEISDKLDGDIDLTKKRELAKKQADISAKLQETKEYDEKIAHIADQKIKLDLDDGVVVNYAKFSVKNPKTGREESLLAKIK